MKCPHCEMELLKDAEFCHQCGLRPQSDPSQPEGRDAIVELEQNINGMFMTARIIRKIFPPTGFLIKYLATEAKEKLAAGDVQGASKSYRAAQIWCYLSFVPFGIVAFIVLYFAFFH